MSTDVTVISQRFLVSAGVLSENNSDMSLVEVLGYVRGRACVAPTVGFVSEREERERLKWQRSFC